MEPDILPYTSEQPGFAFEPVPTETAALERYEPIVAGTLLMSTAFSEDRPFQDLEEKQIFYVED